MSPGHLPDPLSPRKDPIVPNPDLRRLSRIIDSTFASELSIAIRDLFAIGCYLHLRGEPETGSKLCRTALYAAGCHQDGELSSAVLQALPGNERAFADAIRPHVEIRQLVESL